MRAMQPLIDESGTDEPNYVNDYECENNCSSEQAVARLAYMQADAMLEERAKGQGKASEATAPDRAAVVDGGGS